MDGGIMPVIKHLHGVCHTYIDDQADIDKAVDLLIEAIEKEQRVLIVADFDADGATSCALMMRGLAMFGMSKLDYIVPNRFEYGYGLTPEIVELAAKRQPDLLITVDNGISSHAGVEAAKDMHPHPPI